ncbi:hypothetical protein MIND_00453600 [Mycena indigotica]|uniref:C3H1-type domain-containing protein n=1 Tax=Mycena indigotica TaxID=2126181 RepID=A0A8H6SXI4_9AGAR|nr:uncharacterized protein MIND_00453600 [Mycena indigotica]KAF7306622.1 hypothetical protein MIND_00453600 [Mycena indigotica]
MIEVTTQTSPTIHSDTHSWPKPHDVEENWHLNDSRLPHSTQKLPFSPSYMSPLTSIDSWRMNNSGQLVDAATEEWDLADEIVRLKIGQEEIPIRTPAKSKLASAQLRETSPTLIPSVNSSPLTSDHIGASHSRGSSTDSTVSSSQASVASNTMIPPQTVDVKERPHSFSGGLSTADLRRLQQVDDETHSQWASVGVEKAPEQPAFPSLAQRQQPQLYDYRTGAPQNAPNRDDLQIDYNIQQRNFSPLPQAAPSQVLLPPRPTNLPMTYRQAHRGFPQQGLVPSPTTIAYPPMGNSPQLYEMLVPAHERLQAQHNAFRNAHHHSASDPSSTLRDAAALALLNNNMQAFAGNMFPQPMAPPPTALPMYAGQFYAAQDAYVRPDVVTAQAMARLQAQYTGPYSNVPTMGMTEGSLSPGSNSGQGPSANNRKLGLYKTELCRSWEEKGSCRYGGKCQFAHGEEELRTVARHPKYKTEICRTFWVSGSCPYGKRCCFIHTELPPSGAPGDAVPPPPHSSDGRARSMSTNSDPNDASVSLLARIAKREPATSSTSSTATPTETTPSASSGFAFTRPPTGSLRVDTSSIDSSASLKQNKSAYPTFTGNGVLIHPPDRFSSKSPAPVTAGPDLGRHNNSRLEIVGYNNQRNIKAPTPSNANVRSLNGSENDVTFSPSPPARANGHVRAGSAGNWGSFSRTSHLATGYSQASPSTEAPANSPWSTTELAVGSSRLNDKAWA